MLADLYLQRGDTAKAKPNVAAASDMAYTDPDQQTHQRIKDMAVKVGETKVVSDQDAWLKAHPQPAGSMAGMPMTVTPQPAPKAAKK
jgi:hypothetical protein